ncbi:hypothetical protein FB451DRAFT_1413108 [Mycena latifolia]|nr:hypothetical protein FB451DRAFT_1413108 [Mycena latifolia]
MPESEKSNLPGVRGWNGWRLRCLGADLTLFGAALAGVTTLRILVDLASHTHTHAVRPALALMATVHGLRTVVNGAACGRCVRAFMHPSLFPFSDTFVRRALALVVQSCFGFGFRSVLWRFRVSFLPGGADPSFSNVERGTPASVGKTGVSLERPPRRRGGCVRMATFYLHLPCLSSLTRSRRRLSGTIFLTISKTFEW